MGNNAQILNLNFTGYSKFSLSSENFSSDKSDRWNLGKPRLHAYETSMCLDIDVTVHEDLKNISDDTVLPY